MKTRHHRRCRHHGGGNGKCNVILVDALKHRYFHFLFKRGDGTPMTPEEIGVELSTKWIDPSYRITVTKVVPSQKCYP